MHYLSSVPTTEETKIKTILASSYGINNINSLRKNTVGFVNKTYVVESEGSKFVLRKSSKEKKLDHLLLEIELLKFFKSKGYKLSAQVIPNKNGEDITEEDGSYYILLTFVPGELKASTIDLENMTFGMLRSFFRASANFTKVVQGFVPSREYDHGNKPITEILSGGRKRFHELLDNMPNSKGREFIVLKSKSLLSFLAETKLGLEKLGYEKLPKQLVHFDIHPGNIHFEGENVVGIFDFDWIRFDSRIVDLAGTIGQSCYVYGGKNSGVYVKEKIQEGLRAYREEYGESEFSLEKETKLVKETLKAYMFFQALWVMNWYSKNYDEKRELDILKHFVNTCLINDYETLFS